MFYVKYTYIFKKYVNLISLCFETQIYAVCLNDLLKMIWKQFLSFLGQRNCFMFNKLTSAKTELSKLLHAVSTQIDCVEHSSVNYWKQINCVDKPGVLTVPILSIQYSAINIRLCLLWKKIQHKSTPITNIPMKSCHHVQVHAPGWFVGVLGGRYFKKDLELPQKVKDVPEICMVRKI